MISVTGPSPRTSRRSHVRERLGAGQRSAPLGFADGGKVLKYNGISNKWDLELPVLNYETLVLANVHLTGNGGRPQITRLNDNSNLVPLAYGLYDGVSQTLSSNTPNITVTRISLGRYQITVSGVTLGAVPFSPVTVCTLANGTGLIEAKNAGGTSINVYTYNPNGSAADGMFNFLIYNR